MSNKASDTLHRLIKSLSKAEKRYFKIYSSRHVIGEKNNYQSLFDAIDKQEEYDEDKLFKKFKNQAFIKRFSITKNRLYNSILKSLDSYYSNSSIDAQLKRQIHCAEILFNKSLYDQSHKILKSAKKIALKHEKATSLLEISHWEKRLLEKDNYEGITKEHLNQILEDDKVLLNKIDAFGELWNIKSNLFNSLYKSGKARNAEELKKFKQIIENNVMERDENSMFTENIYLKNHIYSVYFYGINNYEKSYFYLNENLSLIENKASFFKEEPNIAISVLTNLMYLALKINKFDEAKNLLKKLKSIVASDGDKVYENESFKVFELTTSAELTLLKEAGEYEKGLALIPAIEAGLEKYSNKLSSMRKAFFYFSISTLFFSNNQFKPALRWINKLLNNIDIDRTQDIHCMAQLYNLIIHLELGNHNLLPYTLRSTQRYLETRHKVYKFESVFLTFVNNILKKRQELSEFELHNQLAKDLQELQGDPFEKPAFEYFDFAQWATNKVRNLNQAI